MVEAMGKYSTDKELFHDLMPVRVQEILLVAPAFDAYTLEEDGLLNEYLFEGYYQLMLANPPRVTNVHDLATAIEKCRKRRFDLIIVMSRLGQGGQVEQSRDLRAVADGAQIYLLLNDNVEVGATDRRRSELLRQFDHIFVWNGNPDIFVAMVQFMENRANVENDTKVGLVRVILLVEDSIRYYSRYLPILYGEIMEQTMRLAGERKGDGMARTLTMRVRPKVLLATTYEEAIELAERYQDSLLCLITDRKFPKGGAPDSQAGIKLIQAVRARNPHIPTLLQSSDPVKAKWAAESNAVFINKNSTTLGLELSRFFYDRLGFGDFVFRGPTGEEIDRASNMKELNQRLRTVPGESLVYHGCRDHFSAWIMARGEVQAARVLAGIRVTPDYDAEKLREQLTSVGRYVERMKTVGRIVNIADSPLREAPTIARLGSGAVGGKARGVAFMYALLTRLDLSSFVPDANIRVPRSAIVGTDEFTEFVERHGLRSVLQELPPDEEIRRRFLEGEISRDLQDRIRHFLKLLGPVPLAVRSSGLLEDSLSHPFSGLYATFFLPNNHANLAVRVEQVCEAIKLVYASVYARDSRAYFEAINYQVEEEQMGVLIQEVIGSQFGDRFYPHISGVAQSYNYYPVATLKPQDGIASIAVGLGKYVVGGEKTFRFAPPFPSQDIVPPREQPYSSQKQFLALDLTRPIVDLSAGDDATLVRLDIADAEADGALRHLASVWDANDDRIKDGLDNYGPRIVNFRNVLKYEQFPLARILQHLLSLIREAMETPVEIEFAVNLHKAPNGKPTFALLQIKHQLQDAAEVNLDPDTLVEGELFLFSDRCVGNGVVEGLRDIVWIDPDTFDKFETVALAAELAQLNERLRAEAGKYILIGPGRWGSSDRHLGIPVTWSMISGAQVIVEYAMENFQADASLGSHFFHNVTSLNVGYFTVPHPRGSAVLDWEWLRGQPVISRNGSIIHSRLPDPVHVVMDGRHSASAIFKRVPEPEPEPTIDAVTSG